MKAFLEERGHDVHALSLVPSNGALGIDGLAEQVKEYADATFGTAFDLVGFSMGGIVGRHYLQRLGGLARVRRFLTIGSPHQGTLTGWLRWNTGARQMRRHSEFLRDLNSDVEMLRTVGFTSIWTPFDLMILPARSSVIPPAISIRVNTPAHALLVRDPKVLRLVHQILS